MTDQQSTITHPEWVHGRRLWMDTPMRDLIHRMRFGDPVKGWEGDPCLELYFDGSAERFEVWRLEDDGEYRFVCRSAVGVPFDERIIDALISWDNRRRSVPLEQTVMDRNQRRDDDISARRDEWVAEEAAPRLHHAFRKDA
jgi:hypothetical protein